MKLTSISKTIYLSEFPTDVLITELYNRLVDYMEDPEPQFDPTIEEMTKREILYLSGALVSARSIKDKT